MYKTFHIINHEHEEQEMASRIFHCLEKLNVKDSHCSVEIMRTVPALRPHIITWWKEVQTIPSEIERVLIKYDTGETHLQREIAERWLQKECGLEELGHIVQFSIAHRHTAAERILASAQRNTGMLLGSLCIVMEWCGGSLAERAADKIVQLLTPDTFKLFGCRTLAKALMWSANTELHPAVIKRCFPYYDKHPVQDEGIDGLVWLKAWGTGAEGILCELSKSAKSSMGQALENYEPNTNAILTSLKRIYG